jgi:hypothetical protein
MNLPTLRGNYWVAASVVAQFFLVQCRACWLTAKASKNMGLGNLFFFSLKHAIRAHNLLTELESFFFFFFFRSERSGNGTGASCLSAHTKPLSSDELYRFDGNPSGDNLDPMIQSGPIDCDCKARYLVYLDLATCTKQDSFVNELCSGDSPSTS